MSQGNGRAAMSVLAAGTVAAVGLAVAAGAQAWGTVPDARLVRTSVAPPLAPNVFFVQADPSGPAESARLRACTAAVTVCMDGDGLGFAANGPRAEDSVVRMSFEGVGLLRWQAVEQLAATGSSFHGRDPSAWTHDLPLHGAAVGRDAKSGVEIRLAGDVGLPAYALRVPPGAPHDSIGVRFDGASGTAVDTEGRLVVSVRGGRWTHSAPRAWQETANGRRDVPCRFVAGDGATARLACGPCDPAATLVIDPTVEFCRTFGEPNRFEFPEAYVSVDAQGRVAYAFAASDNIPNPYYGQPLTTDLLVLRYDATGRKLQWSASLGSGAYPRGIVARDSGAVLVAGTARDGPRFPRVYPAFTAGGGYSDAFVTQLASGGQSIEFSTVYGGTGNADPDLYDPNAIPGSEDVHGVCVDSDGGIVVVGQARSVGAPLVGEFSRAAASLIEGFLFRLSADGRTAVHAGYFGGSGEDDVMAVCAGNDGSVFVVGQTDSTDLPTRDPVPGLSGAGIDGFAARFLPTGEMAWGTRIGGSAGEFAIVVAAATDGTVHVGGSSSSSDLPSAGGGNTFGLGGGSDLFVMHIDPAAGALRKSLRIGGTRSEGFQDMARDASGRLWLIGSTTSSNFPVSNALSSTPGASVNQSFVPFLVVLDSQFGVRSSGYLGGTAYGVGWDVATTGSGLAWLSGQTFSTDFPSVNPGEGPEAGLDFLMEVSLGPKRPTDVTAQALSASSIKVQWSHDGEDVDHFEVEASVVGSGLFAPIGLPAAADRAFTGGNDHPLATVAHRVRAWSVDAASVWSDEAILTLPAAPSAPPSVPGGLALEVSGDGKLHLTWTDTSSDENRFDLSIKPAGGASSTVQLAAGTTSWDVDPPPPDRTVAYCIRAVGAASVSPWAGPVAYTTPPTLDVHIVKGRIRSGRTAKKSSMQFAGTVRRIDGAEFRPQIDGLTLRLGGWAGTQVLDVAAGETGWKNHHGTWTWTSPRRSTTRVHVVYRPKTGSLGISIARVQPPVLEPGLVTTSLGNAVDGGSDASAWRARRGALQLP